MHRTLCPLHALLAFAALALARPGGAAERSPLRGLLYPRTHRVEQVDVYHGVEVADPYRWLEQDVRESEQVREWVEAENEVTFRYLAGIPERKPIEARLTELWNYERYSAPAKEGGHYFFTRNDGLQNQSVLYVQDRLDQAPRVLIDPNSWSEDGTVALAGTSVSDDGRYLAYGVAEAGSDWTTWRVMEIATGELLDDEIHWIKFSGVGWGPGDEGFFYGRYPRPEEGTEYQSASFNQKIFYHRVGTDQSEDVLVYERPDLPELNLGAEVTEDERYLVIVASKGTSGNAVLVRDLQQPYAMPRVLVGDLVRQDHDYDFIGNVGPRLFFRTDDGAARYRVVAIDVRRPAREHWQEVLPESDETLEEVSFVGGRFIAQYLEDAKTRVRVFGADGSPVRDVALPGIGTAEGFHGRADDSETFYVFSSFATPPSIYRYDVATGESTLLRRAEVDFDPSDYAVEQVFFTSKDGTRVPMFLAYKRGLERNGSNPTLLYGYGGFQISLTPYFSVSRLAWMEMGGVFAMANLRGGGEYGEAWHEAGTKLQKQNVFDDFLAAAQWLVDHRYTRPGRLAIQGGSNGGLLVGAAMTQRPGSLRRRPAGGRRDGHAPVRPLHRRTVLGRRLRLGRRPGGVQGPLRLLALPQPGAGHRVPGDAGHDGGHRRPGGAGPQLQVRRAAPARPGGRGARADPDRDAGRPRRRHPDLEADRAGGRRVGVPGGDAGDRSPRVLPRGLRPGRGRDGAAPPTGWQPTGRSPGRIRA